MSKIPDHVLKQMQRRPSFSTEERVARKLLTCLGMGGDKNYYQIRKMLDMPEHTTRWETAVKLIPIVSKNLGKFEVSTETSHDKIELDETGRAVFYITPKDKFMIVYKWDPYYEKVTIAPFTAVANCEEDRSIVIVQTLKDFVETHRDSFKDHIEGALNVH